MELGPAAGVADFVARVGRRQLVHFEFQGYHERLFGRRMIFYNSALLRRYPDRSVLSVAILTKRPRNGECLNEFRAGHVTLKAPSIVLPDLPAELLLRTPKAACFAVGGALGEMSVNTLCRRVVEVMMNHAASEAAWRVARVVAANAGRYKALEDAMEQVRIKPPLTDDLVRYGIDVGYRRGRKRGLVRGREEGLRRALLLTYEARFGTTPSEIVTALEEINDPEALAGWQATFSTRTARGIAAALRRSRQG